MNTVGIRADPNGFNWAVSTGSEEIPELVTTGRVDSPKNYGFPEAANFLRKRLIQIINENRVEVAGVRTPEVMPRVTESFRQRLRIEGVLLATCAELGLKTTQGPLATLSKLLGVESAKVLVEKSDEYMGIDLEKMEKEEREAVLMSVSLLEPKK